MVIDPHTTSLLAAPGSRTPSAHPLARAAAIVAGSALLAGAGYAALVVWAWFRFGHSRPGPEGNGSDRLLDAFMPHYDIVERHHVQVRAGAAVTLASACEQDLQRSAVARAIFKARQLVLRGATADERPAGLPLLPELLSLGWGILADVPGREVVVGAVTRPWERTVIFQAIPADRFAVFQEPGFVKIVVSLRADPLGAGESVFRTETRAMATDAEARMRFRSYWSMVSPGVAAIRWLSLWPLKKSAERRARAAASPAAAGATDSSAGKRDSSHLHR